jgi:arylsulfatase A-like enzyme
MASNGMRFTDAHSGAALSTPTRYSLLTGRYSFRSRLKAGVLGNESDPLIEEDRMTVGRFLQNNGYNTAAFGKWHLGLNWAKTGDSIDYSGKITNGPVTRGFDYYFGVNTNNNTFFIENDRAVEPPTVPKPAGMYKGEGLMAPGWTYENMTPAFTNKAVEYIKNTTNKRDVNKPFFIYFAATIPHTPIVPVDEFKGTSKAHLIGDFIQQLDWHVGQIMQALKEEGILDNTLVIFTSDNGPMFWDGTNMQGGTNAIFKYEHNPSGPLRGKKSDIWEAGHRVPFVAQWPGKIPANTVSNEIISLVDFMATCAGIVGKDLPEGAGEDSFNMLPALKAQNTTPIRKELINVSGKGKLALRQGNWKLILAGGSGGFTAPQDDDDAAKLGWPPVQLYNLAEDLGETKNLQDIYPEKVKEMTMLIESIKTGKTK